VLVDDDEVEAVARALYDTLECSRGWKREPEKLRERLRNGVRTTLKKLDEYQEIGINGDVGPLVLAGDIPHSLEFLMNSPDVSALAIPSSRACRVVLRGPDLTIDAANEAFIRAAGRSGFLGLPGREAFPELKDQGYFQLLDQVYKPTSHSSGS
jgi:hypothetical protein